MHAKRRGGEGKAKMSIERAREDTETHREKLEYSLYRVAGRAVRCT
jgi:hypothetical protein